MSSADAGLDEGSVIVFEEGIIGVPRARRFHLLERPGSPLRVLRCLDIEGFALPVVDPMTVDSGYRPTIGARRCASLGLGEDDAVLLLAVATLVPEGALANLRAPIVINPRQRRAIQVILDDRRYPVQAPLSLAET